MTKVVGESDVTTFHVSATRTSSGNTNSQEVFHIASGIMFLDVTSASGTLDIKIQTTPKTNPTANDWYDLGGGSFTQVTATGKQSMAIVNFGHWVRCAYTIGGGSPSFTFEILFVPSEYKGNSNFK